MEHVAHVELEDLNGETSANSEKNAEEINRKALQQGDSSESIEDRVSGER